MCKRATCQRLLLICKWFSTKTKIKTKKKETKEQEKRSFNVLLINQFITVGIYFLFFYSSLVELIIRWIDGLWVLFLKNLSPRKSNKKLANLFWQKKKIKQIRISIKLAHFGSNSICQIWNSGKLAEYVIHKVASKKTNYFSFPMIWLSIIFFAHYLPFGFFYALQWHLIFAIKYFFLTHSHIYFCSINIHSHLSFCILLLKYWSVFVAVVCGISIRFFLIAYRIQKLCCKIINSSATIRVHKCNTAKE